MPQSRNVDLQSLVIQEVDDAREVFEVAQQLVHGIPYHSFDQVIAAGAQGKVTFRGNSFNLKDFASQVTPKIFPVDTPEKLVALIYQAVRLAPKTIKYTSADTAYAQLRLRRFGVLGLPHGDLGSTKTS